MGEDSPKSENNRIMGIKNYNNIFMICACKKYKYRINFITKMFNDYINKDDLQSLIKEKGKNDYSDYLKGLYE